MAALALALIAVVGAVLASALSGERTRGAGARAQGAAGVAAVYGYPPRCLIVTISTADRTYARADFNRATPCGRFDGYATAIFHRVDGSWRPVLDAVAYSCPVASVPSPVRAELGVCP